MITEHSSRQVSPLRRGSHHEALSPWIKLQHLVFRATEIRDEGEEIVIRARVGDVVLRALENLNNQTYRRARTEFAYGHRVVEATMAKLARVVTSAGLAEVTVELTDVERRRPDHGRMGTAGRSAEELTELGVRHNLLGEPLPESLQSLDFLADPGFNQEDLSEAFELNEEIVAPITQLILSEALVGSGRAEAITKFILGPRMRDGRRILIEWQDPRIYSNLTPEIRSIEGTWRQRILPSGAP